MAQCKEHDALIPELGGAAQSLVNHRGWLDCCTDKTLLKAIADTHRLEEYGVDELVVVNEIRSIRRLAIRRSEAPKIANARVQYKDIEVFDGLLGEQQVANGSACDHRRAIESGFDAAQECLAGRITAPQLRDDLFDRWRADHASRMGFPFCKNGATA
jgi:hypothetical protein